MEGNIGSGKTTLLNYFRKNPMVEVRGIHFNSSFFLQKGKLCTGENFKKVVNLKLIEEFPEESKDSSFNLHKCMSILFSCLPSLKDRLSG